MYRVVTKDILTKVLQKGFCGSILPTCRLFPKLMILNGCHGNRDA